ncbi:protease inhibitor I9 family protein [Prevotella falsenii]|uniref:protease inhibitor I9 family protein n=1 Tax=Prevotella falsenii TaxID=515414 RepID=UPI000468D344|nr:protease inhibitor I9 family protein [Prevotella falsenii]
MDKISFELQREINSKPLGEFDVIITLMEGVNAESLNLKSYRVLMSNILAARLTAKEIHVLAQNEGVQAIEPDAKMGIL